MNLRPIKYIDDAKYDHEDTDFFESHIVKISTIAIIVICIFVFIGLFFRMHGLNIVNSLRNLRPYLKTETNKADIPFKIQSNKLTQKIAL